MDAWKCRWGVAQWAAYFENQALPVMTRSKETMVGLEQSKGDLLSPREMSEIVLGDPLLCLCLLRQAERNKSHRLDNETTTALAAIMQLGADGFRSLLLSSPEVNISNSALLEVEARATTAARIALRWASGHMDLNPEELAVAALLADAGELLLEVYEPHLPHAAREELQSGRAQRSAQAQIQACGFSFKQLTMRCADLWKLPSLVIQLLHGADSARARLTRIASNAARHLIETSDTSDLALACDVAEAHQLMPSVSLKWLVDELIMQPEEKRADLLRQAELALVQIKPKPDGPAKR